MTTTVTVQAHCGGDTEVLVTVSDKEGTEDFTLQDGESTECHAYDERLIQVKERLKDIDPP